MSNIVIYAFIASEEDDTVDVYCNSSAKKARHGSLLERINELECQLDIHKYDHGRCSQYDTSIIIELF